MASWYSRNGDNITLMLHIQPGARQSAISGLHGEALKIRLASPPIEGRANEALMRFIADRFCVPLRNVELKQGGQSRFKRIEVRGSSIDPDSLLQNEQLPGKSDLVLKNKP